MLNKTQTKVVMRSPGYDALYASWRLEPHLPHTAAMRDDFDHIRVAELLEGKAFPRDCGLLHCSHDARLR